MIVNFTARRTELTDEITDYCQKRLKRMEKILDDVLQIEVILSEQRSRKRVDLQVKRRGEDFVISEETNDLFNSLNKAFDSLENKIVKERRKMIQKRRRRLGRERAMVMTPVATPAPKLQELPYYSDKPISLQEALLHLEEGKKEVFLFRKEDSEAWAAVFRRKDGKIAIVDPEK
ncbi:MAG: ribosome-associated translation inhibitor RaiA [Acidobacteriota bacterium]|nr:ribosome-associated translation inhibitor RaiA [Acidobacteriota bacterium]MDW3229539.1 ribosome-associated translation inhibitor RaiA [Acidobacteriota bacterium]